MDCWRGCGTRARTCSTGARRATTASSRTSWIPTARCSSSGSRALLDRIDRADRLDREGRGVVLDEAEQGVALALELGAYWLLERGERGEEEGGGGLLALDGPGAGDEAVEQEGGLHEQV